jgi:hypothetical protein
LGAPIPEGTLDLFATGGVTFLKGVPVRTVSDVEIPNTIEFSTIRLRRMGVAFQNLTQPQKQALRAFLRENGAEFPIDIRS